MKRRWIVLTYEIWRIKWNIDSPTFDYTYLRCRSLVSVARVDWGTLSPGHVITSPISFFFAFLNRSRQADVVSITIYLNSRLLIEKQISKVVRIHRRNGTVGSYRRWFRFRRRTRASTYIAQNPPFSENVTGQLYTI